MNPRTKELLEKFFSGSEAETAEAERELIRLKDPECAAELLPHAVDWDSPLWMPAAAVIAALGEQPEVSRFFSEKLAGEDSQTRALAAWALKKSPQRDTVGILEKIAESDENSGAKAWALHALEAAAKKWPKLKEDFIAICSRAIKSDDCAVRASAYECLSVADDMRCDGLLEKAAKDPDSVISEVNYPIWKENRRRCKLQQHEKK